MGTIENGVVKLPPEAPWPDGTKVRVERVEQASSGNKLTRRLRELSATVVGLPADLAEEHDHYIHHAPRRAKA